MDVTGEGQKGILFIAEAPGKTEDKRGVQLIGKAGKLLRTELEYVEIDLDKDCWKINAVNCKPPIDRAPTIKQINCCRFMWQRAVKNLKPKKIILLGEKAIISFLGDRTSEVGGVSKWVGHQIPDQDYNCWVYPTYHPSYILRNLDCDALENMFFKHLSKAIKHNKPFPRHIEKINIITEVTPAINYLERLLKNKPKLISFDYETTGIKPHREGHAIKTVAFSFSKYRATAMPIFLNNSSFMNSLKEILKSKEIKKTAHNLKFEDQWTAHFITQIKGWIWDSMLGSHIIDNRGRINSLKIQTYLNFGVINYEDTCKKFLTGIKKEEDSKSGNRFNCIEDAPLEDLLYYNGLDALFGYRLTLRQMGILGIDNKGYKLMHNGSMVLSNIESRGWRINLKYFNMCLNKLNKKEKTKIEDIKNSKENQI
jgi:DNA polymerase